MAVEEKLAAPRGLRAGNALGRVILVWNRSTHPNVASYEVYRSVEPGGPYDLVSSVQAPKYVDKIAGGPIYYYVVKAIDQQGNESPPSIEVRRGALHTVRYQEDKGAFTGTWKDVFTWQGSSEAYKDSAETDATVTFEFTGCKVTWIAHRAPDLGIARVYLDDIYICHVDLYAAGAIYQYPVFTSVPLKYGPHTLKILVTGKKNAQSKGGTVSVDAFDVVQE